MGVQGYLWAVWGYLGAVRSYFGSVWVFWGQFQVNWGQFGAIWGRSWWLGAHCGVFLAIWGPALGYLEAGQSGSSMRRRLQHILGRLVGNLGRFGAILGLLVTKWRRHHVTAAPRDGDHLGAAEQNGGGEAVGPRFHLSASPGVYF